MLRIHIFIIAFFVPAVCMAEPPLEEPTLPDGTEKALKQIAGFRYPKGLKVELFAAEPLLGSPVAISVDEKGRIFVAEEYRFSRGTEENRTRPFFLEDDLQLKSVSDRLAMFKKWQSKFDGECPGSASMPIRFDYWKIPADRAGRITPRCSRAGSTIHWMAWQREFSLTREKST